MEFIPQKRLWIIVLFRVVEKKNHCGRCTDEATCCAVLLFCVCSFLSSSEVLRFFYIFFHFVHFMHFFYVLAKFVLLYSSTQSWAKYIHFVSVWFYKTVLNEKKSSKYILKIYKYAKYKIILSEKKIQNSLKMY